MLLPMDTSARVGTKADPRMHSNVVLPRTARAGTPSPAWRATVRRGLNVALAAIALILLMPLMILIGILIKATSPGPILFTQPRVGVDRRGGSPLSADSRRVVDHGGKLFRIYKFRTMHVVPEGVQQRWAVPDDPRVTSIGRILRKYRLDELPQLFNVLAGDMNLVGPRPEQPRIFAELRQQIPNYQQRQRVLPGITGWAQVNQSYDRDTEDVKRKVEYDLEYIEQESPLQDLKILLYTVPAVFSRRGW